MQKQDIEDEQQDYTAVFHSKMNKVTVLDLAKELHLGRNTVANIAKELSIRFKYEDCSGKIRAYVSGEEADKIRRVFDERFKNQWDEDEMR